MDKLKGEIRVGDIFIWEPHHPTARAVIEVVATAKRTDGELWIKVDRFHRKADRESPKGCWNSEDRFREACIRVGSSKY